MLVLLFLYFFINPTCIVFILKHFMLVSIVFVHNDYMYVFCNSKAHNFIMQKNNGRGMHLVASVQTSHMHTTAQSCKHKHMSMTKLTLS